ncbi:DUF6176 family protein [Pseudoalteromonas denitrificans]|uniref:Uncharacterized protein n=1 Tax=Pseudoalteromonas denitrificans DSM 6059 TaxID=1123010 RepID=A0A1I1P448_9GAMM|nr:DUF6176 family protein [Pseudoalteromonas denitrificans]SFD04587.1 hypothetical protein SAMN02745724_03297 [Pseudoalteromonas denitrificans DSM 6059]
MMEFASGLIKLKPGTEDKVDEWKNTIASRLDEAAATLQDEEVQIESWFKIDIDGNKYLLWYLRAKSIKRVFEVSMTLKHPIDQFHYTLMAEITANNGNILAEPLLDVPRDNT